MVEKERVVSWKFFEKYIKFIHDFVDYIQQLGFQMHIEKKGNIVSKL